MKPIWNTTAAALAATALLGLAYAAGPEQGTRVDGVGATAFDTAALETRLGSLTGAQLSNAEKEGLLFMREEEKLAFDVYNALATRWGRPFSNIARAEQTHMDAVKVLLDRYQLQDPMTIGKAGTFANPTLQRLYNDLVKAGRVSRTEALKVGAQIEELDIFDLQRWIKQTTNTDILSVYANLEKGSRNHLRAFDSNLTRFGATYEPKHLSSEAYRKIVTSPMERGRGGN
ncbi:MAG: DUF2202 domain-containing protein [Fimbriimonadaceae bacterium]|nr:DUF2202 domain-containing protein [Chthonomonadaceae bacterium]MCO5298068.1 DUF2202 domain-containing protein [Fimbriimonadaceae bacterium]